jgi:hypothetical protein
MRSEKDPRSHADPERIVHGAGPVEVVRMPGNKDCRDGMPRFNEILIEFDSGHHGILMSAIKRAVSTRQEDARADVPTGLADLC